MEPAELELMGHERMSAMEAIRAKCLDCVGGSWNEVRLCTAITCPNWPFRTGKNPWRAPSSEEVREARREHGRKLAQRRWQSEIDQEKLSPDAPEPQERTIDQTLA
jgi:hypothetical protein